MVEKKHPDAILPIVATSGSAGNDLYALEGAIIPEMTMATIKTGIKAKIPDGYVGLVRGRSGLAFKEDVWCFEGTIDSDYDGEIGVQLFNTTSEAITIEKGQRMAQLVIVPFMVDKSLVKNVTREGGFGSTD